MPLFDKLAVVSPDFENLGALPLRLAADTGNEVPVIEFSGAPAGTVELALICHDPDAPLPEGFTHWTVYGIPADATTLDLGGPEVRFGPNGIGESAWTGPQPPHGHGIHHYYFHVYALAAPVVGTPTREEFLAEYAPSIIEQARTVGTFLRN
jgi:Raf kinase inhibitor-like YbhB/YbcL family protein